MENTIYQEFVTGEKRCGCCRGDFDPGGFNRTCNYFQVSAYKPGSDHFRKNNQRKFRNLNGEVVVFLSLIFILMITFVAALLDGVSIQMAKNYRRADMNRAMECVFAEYQKELLEHYDVFALDASYETGQYAEENLADRLEYYGVSNTEQKIKRVQFLTDRKCQAFHDQITAYMENRYGIDSVRDMLGMTSVWNSQDQRSESYAREEEEQEQRLESLLLEQEGELPSEDNPIEHVEQIRQSPILSLVVPRERTLSEKSTEAEKVLANRNLNTGYGDFSDVEGESTTLSNLLYGEYFLEHFSSFIDEESNGGALDYELEYILSGKYSDKENLEAVVKKLMLIRYVPNFAYIQTDSEMQAEAEAIAGTLCTFLAVPEITAAAAQVILAAWAYGETIIDLRALLSGKKVPVVKSKETWQLQLSELLKLGTEEDQVAGMDSENGMDYSAYLRMLIFLGNKDAETIRTLSVIELNLQTIYGQTYFQADLCISRLEMESISRFRRGITYQYKTYYGYR